MEEIFGELNATTFENQSDKEKPFVLTRKECRKKTSFFHAPKNEFLLNAIFRESVIEILSRRNKPIIRINPIKS